MGRAGWPRHRSHNPVAHVDLALEVCGRFQVNYYDALILATARLAACAVVFSDDPNHGQDYGGVRVEDPFRGL